MDPEVARMLADLGVSRRDVLSAPSEEIRGRPVREDPHHQAALAEDEARRRRIREGGPETAEAAVLRAWNTESTFENTGDDGGLENRYNGQGHRAALAARRQYDPRWEATEARVGEERRRYLQEQDASRNANYIAARGPPARSNVPASTPRVVEVRDSSTRNPVQPRQPRSQPGPSSGTRPASRMRLGNPGTLPAATSRTHSSATAQYPRQRAPSPRSFGTIRFPPVGSGTTRAPPQPGPPAHTSVTTHTQRPPAPAPRAATPAPRATASAQRAATPAPPASTPAPPATAPAPRATASNRGVPARRVRVASRPRTTTTAAASSAVVDDARMIAVRRAQAMRHAVHPTTYAHVYVEHPERLCHLDWARKEIAQDVVKASVSDQAAADYLDKNEECAWLVEAARIARIDAREKTDEQNATKYDGNPDLKYIFEAAKAAVTSNANAGSASPVVTSDDHQGTQQVPASSSSAQNAVDTILPQAVTAASPAIPPSGVQPASLVQRGLTAVDAVAPQTDAVPPTVTAPLSVQLGHPMQSGQNAVNEDVAEPAATPRSGHAPVEPSTTATAIIDFAVPSVPRGRLTATFTEPRTGGTTPGRSSSTIDPISPTVPRGRMTTTSNTPDGVDPAVRHPSSTTNTAAPTLPRARVRATLNDSSSSDAAIGRASSTATSALPATLRGQVTAASANLSSNNAASGRPVSTLGPAVPSVSRGTATVTSANRSATLFEQLGLAAYAPAAAWASSETRLGRFGPLGLADSMSDLSQNMRDVTRGLSGVRMAEDGLCEWAHDLNEVDRFFKWPANFGI